MARKKRKYHKHRVRRKSYWHPIARKHRKKRKR